MTADWRDVAFKLFWTVVATAAGFVAVEAANWPQWWAVPAAGLANVVLALARQKTGTSEA